MEVYFGGAFQGKLDYVLKKKGNLRVADGKDCDESSYSRQILSITCIY